MYAAIGYGGLTAAKAVGRIRDDINKSIKNQATEKNNQMPLRINPDSDSAKQNRHAVNGVIVEDIDSCMIKFSKCCAPVPGDPIIGFITKGYGISVHKKDCPNVISGMQNPESADRFVSAEWDIPSGGKGGGSAYEALMSVRAVNSISLLANITAALMDMHVTLSQISTQNLANGMIVVNLTVICKNLDHYYSIVSRIKGLKDVESVTRGYS
jgi:GTP pyrophosphokinase